MQMLARADSTNHFLWVRSLLYIHQFAAKLTKVPMCGIDEFYG